jgi:hypothetical protein
MTIPSSLLITATWLGIAAILALALTYPAILAICGLITVLGCIAAADRRPKRRLTIPDRPVSILGGDAQGNVGPVRETLPAGFMGRFNGLDNAR